MELYDLRRLIQIPAHESELAQVQCRVGLLLLLLIVDVSYLWLGRSGGMGDEIDRSLRRCRTVLCCPFFFLIFLRVVLLAVF